MARVYNFSAGPAVLPEEVLKEAADEMLDYQGTGMSVMEMSHRSAAYDKIIKDAEQDLRDLMEIPDNYKVLFLQGGASQQFAMIPMNLMKNGVADYIVTGQWAKKAYNEACKYGKAVKIGTTSGFHSKLYYNDQTGLLYKSICTQDTQSISSYAMVSGTLQETLLCKWDLWDNDYYRQNSYYDLTRMDHVFLLVENGINDYVFQNSALQSENDSPMTIEEYAAHVNGASQSTEAPQQQETTPPAAAASEDTLKEQVLSKCGNSPLDWYYDDFDGDGNKEAFAMAYQDNGMGGHEILGLFYVNAQGTVTDLGTDFWGACGVGRIVAYNSSKKFFVFDTNNGGSGSTDYLYGVTNGACYSSNLSGSLHGFQVDENGAYTFEDGSAAHERPQIRLTYDESTGDFHQ